MGKPTLTQAFDIGTFPKGVEQEVKKMAKVAIQSALPGDKVLNDVVVRTIGDINKTMPATSPAPSRSIARRVTMLCMRPVC
jgi:hypothetical protein